MIISHARRWSDPKTSHKGNDASMENSRGQLLKFPDKFIAEACLWLLYKRLISLKDTGHPIDTSSCDTQKAHVFLMVREVITSYKTHGKCPKGLEDFLPNVSNGEALPDRRVKFILVKLCNVLKSIFNIKLKSIKVQ